MKKSTLPTSMFFCFMLLFCCCEKDQPKPKENKFMGKWQVNRAEQGWHQTETFLDNEIIWDFYSTGSLEILFNIVLSDSKNLPYKTDTLLFYTYDSIYVSIGQIMYKYSFNENTLILNDNIEADGTLLELEKAEDN